MTGTERVWFITGASRGLGHAFTRAALERGERVVAAARTAGGLDALAERHPGRLEFLRLDVTDREAVHAALATAAATFGRLDVVVNNAGTMTMGMVEEFTEAQARAAMEVNFFGALWVSQAAVAALRGQGRGHLIQISSIGALGGFAATGLYSASKWALEGMSEALAMEAAHFGVRLSIVEPGGYWTDLYSGMAVAEPEAAYAPLREELERRFAQDSVDSEPRLAAEALMHLVDAPEPPLRLLLGGTAYDAAVHLSQQRMETWSHWEEVSRAAEHAATRPGA